MSRCEHDLCAGFAFQHLYVSALHQAPYPATCSPYWKILRASWPASFSSLLLYTHSQSSRSGKASAAAAAQGPGCVTGMPLLGNRSAIFDSAPSIVTLRSLPPVCSPTRSASSVRLLMTQTSLSPKFFQLHSFLQLVTFKI